MKTPLRSSFRILGIGHKVGSRLVENSRTAVELGLPSSWFADHIGVVTRTVCAEHESVLTLAVDAVSSALLDAGLSKDSLGSDTILLHIQNGLTHATPPAGTVLAGTLGLNNIKVLSLDGVCGEPVNALEIAALMLNAGRCRRVIISAAVDFMPIVDPADRDTVGLFGAGAGAVILEHNSSPAGLLGLNWITQPSEWTLGVSELHHWHQAPDFACAHFTRYKMRGQELARLTVKTLKSVIMDTLSDAEITLDEVNLLVSHQPNVKMLKMGLRRLGLDKVRTVMSGENFGNLGPASLLVSLSCAKNNGLLSEGGKVLLVSFGLGFSAGAAVIQL